MSGRIPQSFINDLLARIDIVEIIDARVQLKKAGKNYQARCPFHDEKTPSFSVSPDKQFYHCFGCGVSGSALTFLMEYERLEFVEAVEALAAIAGVEVPREVGRSKPKPSADLYEILGRAGRRYQMELKGSNVAIDYLKSRGITGVTARDFGLGYAPPGWDTIRSDAGETPEKDLIEAGLLIRNENGRVYDRFRDRIMFPIRDTRGRVIGFGGRVLSGEDGPKYLNSPETPVFHKGEELYGLFEARRALRQVVSLIVVEGYMDVVALAQAGFANCVATLGTATGEAHFRKLYRYTDRVVCCFDGDSAGRRAAWKALESALPTLVDGKQLSFVFLPDGEDPDSLIRNQGKQAFQQHLDHAISGLDYLFEHLALGIDLTTLDGRARLSALVQPLIDRVPDGVLKRLLGARLGAMTGLDSQQESQQQARVQRRPTGSQRARQNATDRLSERLLTYLLKQPVLAAGASVDSAQWLPVLRAYPDQLFSQVFCHIAESGEDDVGAILAHWMGEPAYPRLLELAQKPVELPAQALGAEFQHGVSQLCRALTRASRQVQLADLRENPSKEALARLASQKSAEMRLSGVQAASGTETQDGTD